MSTTTQSPWADGDVERATEALSSLWSEAAENEESPSYGEETRAVLDALAPRVAELQRAAKVGALTDASNFFARNDMPTTAARLDSLVDKIERGEW